MSAPAETKKRLALAIINFLQTSSTDGTLSTDDRESVEIATQLISDAFKVDASDKVAMDDALGGQSLVAIYSVFDKMKANRGAAPKSPATPAKPTGPSDEDKAKAEALKAQGNGAMAKREFEVAIDYYTKALELVPKNPIYLSNRAAAYSNVGKYELAIEDAQIAVDTDPSYTKAWSRLGHARWSKGDSRGAMEAYKAGIDAEGNGGSEIMKRGYETAKKKVEEDENVSSPGADALPRASSPRGGAGAGGMPDLSSLASMLGGGGGAPGGGGMGGPGGLDLGSIMSNPMFSKMAENLMSNPGLMQNLMNNPRLKEMMDGVGGGGGMPDMSSLMSDPTIAEMAKNLMGGAGPSEKRGDGAGPAQ